ncbi:MAG TPA: ABC transporter permease [Euryarchaeota archaeon]|nr:macrolide export ATP-binding/permease protein MacB [archaeon BMS3Abin16]HDH28808.1 ABC transporter permease [Euryarchaeota archaeon]
MVSEYFTFAYKSLSQQKSRAALTLLGMIIGIAVIVALISLGTGMRASISGNLEKVGADRINIFPAGLFSGGMGGPPQETVPFSEKELNEIARLPGVKDVQPYFFRSGEVKFRNEVAFVNIGGGTEEILEIYSNFYNLKEGRYVKDFDTRAVDIGIRLAEDTFETDIRVGDFIEVNGKKFEVVGIFTEIGNQQDDTTVYMPIKAGQTLYDARGEISMMIATADDERKVKLTADRIEVRLKKLRGGKDFEIATTADFAKQINQVLGVLTFVLGGIASISIIVGGVIIMNTMLMSVFERTPEIGILKATGAKQKTILLLFLTEAGFVGLMGGILGFIVGAALSIIIDIIGTAYVGSMFQTKITIELVVGSILFSFIVGAISGLYPAWQASKLRPIEALRYE